jgi:hypothetical protein
MQKSDFSTAGPQALEQYMTNTQYVGIYLLNEWRHE